MIELVFFSFSSIFLSVVFWYLVDINTILGGRMVVMLLTIENYNRDRIGIAASESVSANQSFLPINFFIELFLIQIKIY